MGKPIANINTIVINTPDPRQLAAFWMKLLDVGISREVPGGYFVWLEPQQPGGVRVAFQQVEAPTPGPNRLHMDTTVRDLTSAIQQIKELGGSLLAEQEVMGFRWNVMADPEGNEFCIAAAGAH